MYHTRWIMCLMLLAGPRLWAQETSIDRYFAAYQEDARFSTITMTSRMFALYAELDLDDPDHQVLVEALEGLKGLKVLIGNQVPEAPALFAEAVRRPAGQMAELLSIREPERAFTFFLTETNGRVSELLMVGHEQQQLIMMSLTGDIDLRRLAELSQRMNINGFQNFEKIGQ